MLSALASAFKDRDLRKKILFTIAMVILYRIGAQIPSPGVDYPKLRTLLGDAMQGENAQLYSLVNLFSGGALLQLSVFAIGIMPYITASIIVQLLTVVIPYFEQLKQEGQSGQAKMTQYTRYLTIALAVLQSAGIVALADRGQLLGNGQSVLVDGNLLTMVTIVVVMTAGAALVMWMGELITDRGVGNGMSLLIFTSIVSSFPGTLWGSVAANGRQLGRFFLVMLVGLVIVAIVVFVEQCQRRVPVQYAKRMVGRQVYGGTSTYIPMKINMANVIPIIFASSLLQLPTMVATFQRNNANPPAWAEWIQTHLGMGSGPWYSLIFFTLIVFFTFFYVSITFNPEEVADNMKKYGGFIPGIRAGRPTAQYLDYILTRLTSVGALYLGLLSLIPVIAFTTMNVQSDFPFGGASLLIMVGVGLETVKQIESQLQQRHYEGFLR